MSFDFEKLKKKIELSKVRSRKIKSLVDSDNIVEETSRMFYILKDNLKDIYEGQLRLRQQIEKIEEVKKIKLSFIKEVSGMLSKSVVNEESLKVFSDTMKSAEILRPSSKNSK